MHPAFSGIFVTTLSGAGYGLLAWSLFGLLLDRSAALRPGIAGFFVAVLLLALVLITVGLLSSLAHLGQPQRAWRAFSQWRSSWLSREGVLAVAAYAPVLALFWQLSMPWRTGSAVTAAAAVLPPSGAAFAGIGMLLALLTVACTAMIYASLKPVPAWSHALVLPVYLLFALHVGGLLAAACLAWMRPLGPLVALAVLASSFALWRLKRKYWRDLDGMAWPARAAALGLPRERGVQVFERPHTEANYLTREMGFVLARRHATRLRAIALALFAGVPALCALPLWLLPPFDAGALFAIAALSAWLGSVVERWLFFAEARHLVTLYY